MFSFPEFWAMKELPVCMRLSLAEALREWGKSPLAGFCVHSKTHPLCSSELSSFEDRFT
jgi:hypothetical protein